MRNVCAFNTLLGLVASLGLAACDAPGGEAGDLGTVQLPLSTTLTDGTMYRLQSATFVIQGADEAVEVDGSGVAIVERDLPVGDYLLTLADGWRMQEKVADGPYRVVEAVLISPNPRAFSLGEFQTTVVALRFRVGEDAIALGHGRVQVVMEIDAGESPCEEVDWYRDADGDGFGDAGDHRSACTAPPGYIAGGDDCDDGDATVKPDAIEVCDDRDNDCDGEIDEDCPSCTSCADFLNAFYVAPGSWPPVGTTFCAGDAQAAFDDTTDCICSPTGGNCSSTCPYACGSSSDPASDATSACLNCVAGGLTTSCSAEVSYCLQN